MEGYEGPSRKRVWEDDQEQETAAVKKIKMWGYYYEVLNVNENATGSDFKKAYLKLSLQFHPDKNKSPSATEAFKAIGNAYAVLSDTEKRREYDLFRLAERKKKRERKAQTKPERKAEPEPERKPKPERKAEPELHRRPLVERIVHTLAVQPYTRDDLLSKLCGQGLRDCDRRIFKLTLLRVALLKRDGRFHLATWKGVDACWPFYTNQEAQVVKERKAHQSNHKRKL